ncbi:MAG: redoxin domain-containing protein [Anaerolineae bacterium]|nr:redoxin domain-containing protein [Anaerolineae bacterium]
MTADNLTIGLAFVAGFISFISPCVLPLVPAYIGYMGGRVTNTVASQVIVGGGGQAVIGTSLSTRFTTLTHGLFFVAGFTAVFVSLGLLSTAFIQQIGGQNINLVTSIIGRIGGVIIIFFGLHFMGVLPTVFNRLLSTQKGLLGSPLTSPIMALAGAALILWGLTGTLTPALVTTIATTAGEITRVMWPTIIALVLLAAYLLWLVLGGAFTRPDVFWSRVIMTLQTLLYTDTRKQMQAKSSQGLGGSALMGVIFSAGWTPCIGPVYGAVLTLAANTGDVGRAGTLLAAYSFGLGVPFLLTALLLDGAQGVLRRLQRHMHKIELVSGAFLILIGFLVASGSLQTLSQSLAGQFADVSIQLEENVLGALTGESQDAPVVEPTAQPSAQLNSITGAAAGADAVSGTNVGNLAPDFTSVTDTGETVTLSELRGQIVLVNFWATWCGPCRIEMPEFEAAYQANQDAGFTILAINNQEGLEQVSGFRDEMGVSFPFVMDEAGDIQREYGVFSYPSTFLLDRDGVIIARQFGPLTAEQIEQLVSEALS